MTCHHLRSAVLLAGTVLLFALFAPAAQAQRRDVGLALAKVCVNEAGFTSLADCAMIWQVVQTHHQDARRGLAWLRAHSRRVLGSRRCRRNCRWSRNLSRSLAAPQGWPQSARWRPEAWQAVLTLADALVAGERAWAPCKGVPVTWGGRMDRAGALARGLVPLTCYGTRNHGWARPQARRVRGVVVRVTHGSHSPVPRAARRPRRD